MKYLRFISIMALLTITVSVFGKTEWKKTTVKYKGNTYIVQYTERSYSIQNKEDVMPKGTATALSRPISDEAYQRIVATAAKIDSIVYSVFPQELWPRLKKGHIAHSPYFSVKTSDYIGGYTRFNIKIKDIVTIDKVYEIEQKLKAAHLNVGKQIFTKPNKKYF